MIDTALVKRYAGIIFIALAPGSYPELTVAQIVTFATQHGIALSAQDAETVLIYSQTLGIVRETSPGVWVFLNQL